MTSSTHFPQQNHTTTTTTTTTSTTTNVHNIITKNSNHNNTVTFLFKNNTTTSPPSVTLSSSSSLGEQGERDNTHEASSGSYAANCCYNSFKLSPPFDSAMALTVLILLTALFFMGFFSIYIRKFADENNVDPTRRRRRRAAEAAAAAGETTEYLTSGGKGVDPGVVGSLPVYVYKGGDVEQGIVVFSGKVEERECAICLSEFEEREWVKEIPSCGHVFHVECIDTWLTSHVTCPLCRTAEFFPVVVEKEERENDNNINTSVAKAEAVGGHVEGGVVGGSGVVEVQGNEENNGGGGSDTWQEAVGDVGLSGRVRRTSSCSWFGERVVLHRSSSF